VMASARRKGCDCTPEVVLTPDRETNDTDGEATVWTAEIFHDEWCELIKAHGDHWELPSD